MFLPLLCTPFLPPTLYYHCLKTQPLPQLKSPEISTNFPAGKSPFILLCPGASLSVLVS